MIAQKDKEKKLKEFVEKWLNPVLEVCPEMEKYLKEEFRHYCKNNNFNVEIL